MTYVVATVQATYGARTHCCLVSSTKQPRFFWDRTDNATCTATIKQIVYRLQSGVFPQGEGEGSSTAISICKQPALIVARLEDGRNETRTATLLSKRIAQLWRCAYAVTKLRSLK